MILNAYSIYDRKSLLYFTPWFQSTHGAATRVLKDLVNDQNTSIGRHPADYVLYHIGVYDDAKGMLTPLSPMDHVMDAAALVEPPQADFFKLRETETLKEHMAQK